MKGTFNGCPTSNGIDQKQGKSLKAALTLKHSVTSIHPDKMNTIMRYPTLKIYCELIDGEILPTIAPTLCPNKDDLQKKQCIDSIVFSAKSIFHRFAAPLQHFWLSKTMINRLKFIIWDSTEGRQCN